MIHDNLSQNFHEVFFCEKNITRTEPLDSKFSYIIFFHILDIPLGRCIASWWHKASSPKRVAAVAACGICIYYTGKGLGELLQHSKSRLSDALTPVFAGYGLNIIGIKANCIKLYLKIRTQEQFQQWLFKVENYTFCQEICTALEKESWIFEEFGKLRVSLIPDHFHFIVSAIDGTKIDSQNVRKYQHKITEQVLRPHAFGFFT